LPDAATTASSAASASLVIDGDGVGVSGGVLVHPADAMASAMVMATRLQRVAARRVRDGGRCAREVGEYPWEWCVLTT
jgi:hypothetical protein